MFPLLIIGGGVAAASVALWLYLKGPRCRPGCGRQCRVAVIGDSISAGSGYVSMLDAQLPQYTFDVFGGVGWGTVALLSELRRQLAIGQYDEVIIEGGLNDIARDDNYILDNLHSMVHVAKQHGARVILFLLTPWSEHSNKIKSINSRLRWLAPLWGVDELVDVWSPLADNAGGLRSDLIGDQMGVHPNRLGHTIIARTVLDEAF